MTCWSSSKQACAYAFEQIGNAPAITLALHRCAAHVYARRHSPAKKTSLDCRRILTYSRSTQWPLGEHQKIVFSCLSSVLGIFSGPLTTEKRRRKKGFFLVNSVAPTVMSRKEVNNEQAKWENEKKHKDALTRSISPSLSSLSLSFSVTLSQPVRCDQAKKGERSNALALHRRGHGTGRPWRIRNEEKGPCSHRFSLLD